MEAGYTTKKAYLTLDGKPVDPGRLRQNDRLIVSIEGKSADSNEHQTVLVDMLPAGWEIEGPVLTALKRTTPINLRRIRPTVSLEHWMGHCNGGIHPRVGNRYDYGRWR
jgi:hypothetical protein